MEFTVQGSEVRGFKVQRFKGQYKMMNIE